MAQIVIKDSVFGSDLRKFAKMMGWNEREAIGTLTFLWRETQEKGIITATKEQIADAVWFFDDKDPIDDLMMSLLLCNWIKEAKETGLYEISGNKKQVPVIQAYKERGQNLTRQRINKVNGKKTQNNDAENGAVNEHVNESDNKTDNVTEQLTVANRSYPYLSEANQNNTKQTPDEKISPVAENKILKTKATRETVNQITGEFNQTGPIAEFCGDEQIEEFLFSVSQKAQQNWLKIYQDAGLIRTEILKMITWIGTNPTKAPKSDLTKFIGGWLSRIQKDSTAPPGQNKMSYAEREQNRLLEMISAKK